MSLTRRHLPHWYPDGKALFLTWNLHGALPRNRYPPPSGVSAGKAFVWMDRYLDEARTGPQWLRREDIARVVAGSFHHAAGEMGLFTLHAWVIMPNHVHLLVTPLTPPARFLQSVKGFTAREANKLLNRTGEPFWQTESYDHWVRDDLQFRRIQGYVENNPVRAGLAGAAEEFRWSSAYGVVAK